MALPYFDVMVYNPELQLIGMIEGGRNESFIWTDRYASPGDVQFKGPAGRKNLNILQPGNYLSIPFSPTLMQIDSQLNQTVREQGATLSVTGKSFDSFFKYRYIPEGYTDTKRTVATLVYRLLSRVAVSGGGGVAADVIPNLIVPGVSDPSLGATAEVDFTAGSDIASTIRELCNAVGYGFKVTFNPTTGTLYAQVYSGIESGLVFSPATNTLSNPSYLSNKDDYYNVAFVKGKNHTLTVGPGASLTGLLRRVLYVDASSVETTSANYVDKLTFKGLEALSQHKHKFVFDGAVDPDGIYKYGTDYNLGDIVTISDSWGNDSKARVSEFIWSYDQNGVQAHPSFTAYDETT